MTIRIALNPNTNSRAERVLYRMAEMLPGEWDVWMNRVLNFTGAKTGHVNREADCIFYHRKYGLLIVECKSGKISTRYNEERKRVDCSIFIRIILLLFSIWFGRLFCLLFFI